MKFTWGTGIFLFLILFLAGAAAFIIFASRQQVNLVHKDYYEKGVDYSEQMRINARSKEFVRSIKVYTTFETLLIEVENSLASKIDSGILYLYRPSDSKKDIRVFVGPGMEKIELNKEDLISGRYILKFLWFSEGEKYEVDQPINVQ